MTARKLTAITPVETSKALYVLNIDPDQKIQATFDAGLKGTDFVAVGVKDQNDAIKFLEKEWTNTVMVIAEFNLPNGNAIDLRRIVLKRWRQLPFAISSENFPGNFVSLLGDMESCPLLYKPYTKKELTQLIQDVAAIRIEEIALEREVQGESFDKFTTMLEDMENLILNLENNPSDTDSVQRIFGIIHTIKGSSSFLRSQLLADFCHRCEDALDDVKNFKVKVNKSVISVLLLSKDAIWEIMNALSTHEDKKLDLNQLTAIFKNLDLKSSTEETEEQNSPKPEKQLPATQKVRDWLKVPRSHIEEFLKINGEMTITKNMIDKFIKIEISQNFARSKNMGQLAKLFEQFFKHQQDMQNKMNNLKKVSLSEAFVQVRRDVRTLSDRLKKPVILTIEGDNTYVDDTLVEPISNSLVHFVRNSIDHGLETLDERKKTGKSQKGTLLIRVFEDEERIFIEVKDDGRGIDPEKLRRVIVEKGIYTEIEAAKFDKKALINMIFKAGVSTSSKVTDVSGRGIGLDMVYSSILQIQGRIEVESEVGKGTKFNLSLPLPKSVVIFKSLVVSREGATYAIPQEYIGQVLSTTEQELLNSNAVQTISGKTMLQLKSQSIPLFDLQNILENRSNDVSNFSSASTIVIIQGMHKPYGIIVDAVLGIEDTVVKALDQITDLSQIYMGATIFGDGQVGMILNPNGVTKMLAI